VTVAAGILVWLWMERLFRVPPADASSTLPVA
jgi:hypothetical protein